MCPPMTQRCGAWMRRVVAWLSAMRVCGNGYENSIKRYPLTYLRVSICLDADLLRCCCDGGHSSASESSDLFDADAKRC